MSSITTFISAIIDLDLIACIRLEQFDSTIMLSNTRFFAVIRACKRLLKNGRPNTKLKMLLVPKQLKEQQRSGLVSDGKMQVTVRKVARAGLVQMRMMRKMKNRKKKDMKTLIEKEAGRN
ncbi:hypothetical protein PIB30_010432 [Stylosanthes scabra]|uniref:Uncharacterized protein n=1 Tax=Stylosanthes scabra TaxID=79078 RepID=A0ABU6Y3I0_9FABA|nr:hypothetical protein [Stylosanthes scabra]